MRDENIGTQVAQGGALTSEEMLADREQAVLAGTRLIDAKELAERIGYRGKRGARTVREKASAGTLPSVRIGKDVRFHWPTVLASLGVKAQPCIGALENLSL